MTSWKKTILIPALILMASCVDPYYPPAESSTSLGFMVIDGFLDGSKGTGRVRLSRTLVLGESLASPPEKNAVVRVDSEDGQSFPLTEEDDGVYTAQGLDLKATSTYQLHVKTVNGIEYSSDNITLRQAPALDSVVWRIEDNGVRFYVNGHDPEGKTRYYHYVYTETWEYEAQLASKYRMTTDGFPVRRTPQEQVKICWGSATQAQTNIKATTHLSEDIVSMFPIHFIKNGSRRLGFWYSLLVQQRAIGEEEYQFLELLRRTNETLGGLFDPIPSQVLGNVHNNDNPAEPVLGYFSGGFPTEKRIFLHNDHLPKSMQRIDGLGLDCSTQVVFLSEISRYGSETIIEIADAYTGTYVVGPTLCADCTSFGGTNRKPNYWPE